MYHDLRGPTIPAMIPQTRTSFTTIPEGVKMNLGHPFLILVSPRLTHLHHHHRSPRTKLPSVPPLTSRTRCSPLLSALMHYGTRPKSTESSSHRIWRHFALICVWCWPTRPLFFSSSSRSKPACTSSYPPPAAATATIVTCPITRGVPSTFFYYLISIGDTAHFCFGGEGGGGGGGVCGCCSGFS